MSYRACVLAAENLQDQVKQEVDLVYRAELQTVGRAIQVTAPGGFVLVKLSCSSVAAQREDPGEDPWRHSIAVVVLDVSVRANKMPIISSATAPSRRDSNLSAVDLLEDAVRTSIEIDSASSLEHGNYNRL